MAAHFLVDAAPGAPGLLRRRHVRPSCAISAGALGHGMVRYLPYRGQAPEPRVHAVQPALEHLAHVVQQMPAVGNCRRDAASVLAPAVASHDLDTGPRAQPGRYRLGLPVGQQIDDALPLQLETIVL